MSGKTTVRDSLLIADGEPGSRGRPIPGLVLIFTQGRPSCSPIPMRGDRVVVGREALPDELDSDLRMSRRHAEVGFDGQRLTVRDLGSSNGTFVDGLEVDGVVVEPDAGPGGIRVLRAGRSLFLLRRDIRPFQSDGVEQRDDMIMGPQLWEAWRQIFRLARGGGNLFLHGESGSGKERAARAFHGLGPRSRRSLIPVNCSAIPEGIAERLFFGTKRGAFSGATADARGYVQAADGGILFLDEVAELDLAIQAKLLRVLESKEVLPLGAIQPQPVDFAICAATHKDLRAEVAAGRFRRDLYFRIGRPEVRLPPLRERPEEIPWLIDYAVKQAIVHCEEEASATIGDGMSARLSSVHPRGTLPIHVGFVEQCLLRKWPGNIRELLKEARAAADKAITETNPVLAKEHLDPRAGMEFHADGSRPDQAEAASRIPMAGKPDRDAIEEALRDKAGNIAAAARSLRVHRTQLCRWLKRFGLDANEFRNELVPSRTG